MASGLLEKLPSKLLVRALEHLPLGALLNLSITNSAVRGFVAPSLFKGIRATNRSEDEDAINNVISKFGQYTQRLHFQCHLQPNPLDDSLLRVGGESDDEPPEPRSTVTELTGTAVKVLKGELLPFSSITVEFMPEDDFNGDRWDEAGCK